MYDELLSLSTYTEVLTLPPAFVYVLMNYKVGIYVK